MKHVDRDGEAHIRGQHEVVLRLQGRLCAGQWIQSADVTKASEVSVSSALAVSSNRPPSRSQPTDSPRARKSKRLKIPPKEAPQRSRVSGQHGL